MLTLMYNYVSRIVLKINGNMEKNVLDIVQLGIMEIIILGFVSNQVVAHLITMPVMLL